MAKEWILNQANMSWGLTKKNKVGPVSEVIRKCSPKSLKDWEEYYYNNVYPKQHLEELGVKGIEPRLFFKFYAELFKHLSKPVDLIDLSKKSLFNDLVEETGVRIYG